MLAKTTACVFQEIYVHNFYTYNILQVVGIPVYYIPTTRSNHHVDQRLIPIVIANRWRPKVGGTASSQPAKVAGDVGPDLGPGEFDPWWVAIAWVVGDLNVAHGLATRHVYALCSVCVCLHMVGKPFPFGPNVVTCMSYNQYDM